MWLALALPSNKSDGGNEEYLGWLVLVRSLPVQININSIQTNPQKCQTRQIGYCQSMRQMCAMSNFEALSLAVQALIALIAMLALIFAAFEAGRRRK